MRYSLYGNDDVLRPEARLNEVKSRIAVGYPLPAIGAPAPSFIPKITQQDLEIMHIDATVDVEVGNRHIHWCEQNGLGPNTSKQLSGIIDAAICRQPKANNPGQTATRCPRSGAFLNSYHGRRLRSILKFTHQIWHAIGGM